MFKSRINESSKNSNSGWMQYLSRIIPETKEYQQATTVLSSTLKYINQQFDVEKENKKIEESSQHDNINTILTQFYLMKNSMEFIQEESPLVEIANICKDADKHGQFASKNAEEMIKIGEYLLKKIDQDKLNCDINKGVLPKWFSSSLENLGHIDLYNKFSIKEERNKTNYMQNSLTPKLFFSNFDPLGWIASGTEKFLEDKTYVSSRRNYLMGVICVMWALYNRSAIEGQEFTRGSYSIIDPHSKLYGFLLDYVRLATKEENPDDVDPWGSCIIQKGMGFMNSHTVSFKTSNFAYARKPERGASSHYEKDQNQWGIDIRFAPNELSLELLPNKNKHILFGSIGISLQDQTTKTFIKFEPDPLGNTVEFISHAISYMNSGSTKDKDRREKVPEELVAIYNKMGKSVDVKSAPPIYQMCIEIESANTKIKKEFWEALNKRRYELDKLTFRTGNEVILDLSMRL